MFSAIEAEKRKGSCVTTPMWPAQIVELEVAHVVTVDEDAAAADVVEARHEVGERGLAASRVSDERDGATGGDLEVHVLEDGPVDVREAHAFEGDGAVRLRQRRRVRPLLHLERCVEQLVDAVAAGDRALGEPGEPADDLGREDEHHQVGVEGDELAQGDVALNDLPSAVPEQESDRQVGDEGDERDVQGPGPRRRDARLEDPRAAFAELGELVVLAGEDAHDARADDVLLGRRRDVGDALLHVLEDRLEAAAEAPGDHQQRGQKGERHEGEPPVESPAGSRRRRPS